MTKVLIRRKKVAAREHLSVPKKRSSSRPPIVNDEEVALTREAVLAARAGFASPDSIEFKRALGKAVAETRQHRGLSQSDLADRLGCFQPQVSLVETGRTTVTMSFVHRLAEALEVTPYELLPWR